MGLMGATQLPMGVQAPPLFPNYDPSPAAGCPRTVSSGRKKSIFSAHSAGLKTAKSSPVGPHRQVSSGYPEIDPRTLPLVGSSN